MARHREAPDSAILDCLERVAATGDPARLGAEVTDLLLAANPARLLSLR
ncbi:MAG TPA: hypothetical protein VGP05_12970 [Pseudonocardia sp.]|nr:hypothetical protein [Pseudonocardia sp.]